MTTIRYLLDENVDPLFRTELLRHEPEMIVWRIGDPTTPPRGAKVDNSPNQYYPKIYFMLDQPPTS
jgi:hypothetical protein